MLVLTCLFVYQSSITPSLLIFLYSIKVMTSQYHTCLNPIMLTCIPMKNRGYIVVSIEVVDGSQLLVHIHYMGHCFIGSLAHATFGVLIYF